MKTNIGPSLSNTRKRWKRGTRGTRGTIGTRGTRGTRGTIGKRGARGARLTRTAGKKGPVNSKKIRHNSIFRRTQKLNKNYKLKLDIKQPLFIDQKLVSNMKMISRPNDSGSNSYVYLIHNDKGEGHVLKLTITTNDELKESGNYPLTEVKIYKVMNSLVKGFVTPHTFTIMDSLSVEREKFQSELKGMVPEGNGVVAILTETSMKKDTIMTLYDLLEQHSPSENILLNIIFQVLYTLEAFNMINLKHNDLHMGNIFIIKYNEIKQNVYHQYTLADKTKVFLPNLGYSVRIFDYDRSCKQPADPPFEKQILPAYDDFVSIGQTCDINANFDTYKFLYHLISDSKMPDSIKQIIKQFFRTDSTLITDGTIANGDVYNIPDDTGRRWGMLRGTVSGKDEMKSTHDMLKTLATNFEPLPLGGELEAKYSLRYIKNIKQ